MADVPAVSVTVLTDPYCPWSWAAEPQLRRLQVEFGAALRFTFVIVGLKRDAAALAYDVVEAAAESGMPADARIFLRDPPASTHPAGLAITAVAEQGDPGPYIRRLREAIMLERRPMDTAPALLDAARETIAAHPGLDLERLRIDFGSNAIVERFGADIERGRGVTTPAIVFGGGDPVPPERWREAALAAGAEPAGDGHPGIEDALRRFGPMATPEVAAVCDLPGPRAPAELWRLALEWRVRPRRVPGGELWELA